MLRPSTRRIGFALWLPAVIAFVFQFLKTEGSAGHRLVASLVAGFAVEVGGLIGLIVFTVAAGKLLGESDLVLAQAFELDRHMIGGLLLATVVWLWWQYDRDKVVYEIADCVTDIMKETGVAPREAVLRCYGEIGNDDRESGIEPNSLNGQMFLAAFTKAAQQNAATDERRIRVSASRQLAHAPLAVER
jgi:hypothetical protein